MPGRLASVAFCDELLVVDSGSRDRTVADRPRGRRALIVHPLRGFGAQRNVAIDHADLRLDPRGRRRRAGHPAAAREIEAFLADVTDEVDICAVPCRDLFLGGPLGPLGEVPEVPAAAVPPRALPPRRDRSRSTRACGRSGAPGRSRATSSTCWRPACGRRSATPGATRAWRPSSCAGRSRRGHGSAASCVRPLAKFGYRLLVDGGWRDGWRGLAKISLDCAADALVWVLARAASAPRRRRATTPSRASGAARAAAGDRLRRRRAPRAPPAG